MDDPTANNDTDSDLVNESPVEIPENATKEVRAALTKQAKTITGLRGQVAELKTKLKERKEDQIKMLLFRDFLASHGTYFESNILLADSMRQKKDPDQLMSERLDHCIGLAEVAFQKIKGRLI